MAIQLAIRRNFWQNKCYFNNFQHTHTHERTHARTAECDHKTLHFELPAVGGCLSARCQQQLVSHLMRNLGVSHIFSQNYFTLSECRKQTVCTSLSKNLSMLSYGRFRAWNIGIDYADFDRPFLNFGPILPIGPFSRKTLKLLPAGSFKSFFFFGSQLSYMVMLCPASFQSSPHVKKKEKIFFELLPGKNLSCTSFFLKTQGGVEKNVHQRLLVHIFFQRPLKTPMSSKRKGWLHMKARITKKRLRAIETQRNRMKASCYRDSGK